MAARSKSKAESAEPFVKGTWRGATMYWCTGCSSSRPTKEQILEHVGSHPQPEPAAREEDEGS